MAGAALVGIFLCTDRKQVSNIFVGIILIWIIRAGNVIIGSCNEFPSDPDAPGGEAEEPILGLGHHIDMFWVDDTTVRNSDTCNVDSDIFRGWKGFEKNWKFDVPNNMSNNYRCSEF